MVRDPTGRPQPGEFAGSAQADLDAVPGGDAVEALEHSGAQVLGLLEPLTEAGVAGRSYAPGKWTVKEVLGHLADDQRIFAYRVLCLARGEPPELHHLRVLRERYLLDG